MRNAKPFAMPDVAKVRLAYLVSHPIQYQAPLLRAIAADPEIDLKVFFCSTVSVRAYRDDGFQRVIEWDVELLDGYESGFLPAAFDSGVPGFWRPFNRGLAGELRRGGFDVLWVHGHMRFYHLISMVGARLRGVRVLNRDEAWAKSSARGPLKRALKRALYLALGLICDGYLAIGAANRAYYLANGIDPDAVFAMPYAVDNGWFTGRAEAAAEGRAALRAELGLEPHRPVILFAGKFLARKGARDLIEAHRRLAGDGAPDAPYLVLVGDGGRRAELELLAAAGGGNSVRFAGFRNQSELPAFYDLCDVLVLPARLEPWGLVVNEAMCASRAVIVSDEVGAAQDLVRDGENGAVFPAGDVAALADALSRVLSDRERCREMGRRSREIIEGWSFAEDIHGLKQALRHLCPEKFEA